MTGLPLRRALPPIVVFLCAAGKLFCQSPAISSLSPASATAGGPGFTLTVNGSGFILGVVHWNETVLPTTFVSATQLTATVAASLVATVGTAAVTVLLGGATSNPATFTISPPPTITSLNPNSATAGAAAFTMTVSGSNLAPGAVVRWNAT